LKINAIVHVILHAFICTRNNMIRDLTKTSTERDS